MSPVDPPRRGLGDRVRLGVAWSAAAKGGEKFLSLLVQLVLARLLVPEDFGIIGMAVVFVGIIQVTSELGVGAALVQRRAQDLDAEMLDTAFWTAVGSGIIAMMVCVFAVAPFAAWFYEEPILRGVVAVISLALLFQGVNGVQRSLLKRELRFNDMARITVTSVAVGGAGAILLAVSGFGVWSIAFQGVISAAVSVPLYWTIVGWRPRFQFSTAALRKIFGFGAFVTGYDFVLAVSKNLDYLIIGKFVGSGPLGAYALAFMLTNVFRRAVMSTLNRVMFPVYGKLQDAPERAKRYYLTAVRVNALLAFPVLAFLILFPTELVTLVFGDHWVEAGLPLRLLALAMLIHTAAGTTGSVMRGLGYVRIQFWVNLAQVTLVSLPVLLVGVWMAGMPGAAAGMVLIKLGQRMVGQYLMRRLINVTELDVLRSIAPATTSALLVVAVSAAIQAIFGSPASLPALAGTAGAALVLPGLVTFAVLRSEISAWWALVRRRVAA